MRWQPLIKICFAMCIALTIHISLLPGLIEAPLWANEKQITAVTTQWPPYMGIRLIDKGFLPEVLVEAFDKFGYTVTVEFRPWARALDDVKNGHKDILCGVYYTREREEFLAYSQPITEAQDVLFMKEGRDITYQQLTDLKPYKMGVLRGAAHGKEFDAADFLNKEEVTHYGQNIRKLLVDKIDLMAGPRDVINFIIKRDYPQFVDKILVVNPPLSTNKVYFGFSKKVAKHQELLNVFNEGLDLIKKEGTF
ncbi:MAG: transporter substrate-binding domain-containing protein, partial [Desulfobacterales bacterium]